MRGQGNLGPFQLHGPKGRRVEEPQRLEGVILQTEDSLAVVATVVARVVVVVVLQLDVQLEHWELGQFDSLADVLLLVGAVGAQRMMPPRGVLG